MHSVAFCRLIPFGFAQAPEETLAKEMTHDLEMYFNKIAPFGKEDTAKELQDHAAKTQDTLVDAVENAEVAEIKRAVFRAQGCLQRSSGRPRAGRRRLQDTFCQNKRTAN